MLSRVSLLADRAPEIRNTYPKRSEKWHTQSEILILYEATDRFGIASMNLRYCLGDQIRLFHAFPSNPKRNGKTTDLVTTESHRRRCSEYWLEATKKRGSANISSEHLRVRIVTPEENVPICYSI